MPIEIKKKLRVGVEGFEELRTEDFYYIDKTGLIKDLLGNWAKVNLFTRPRRFGKSLNMSMLRSFFEVGGDKKIFDGLKISKETDVCREYMGKFPVVSISLKGINGSNYETARNMAVKIINEEARRHQYLLDSSELTQYDKDVFLALLDRNMDDATLFCSLRELSLLLQKHYDHKVILLIDEYDVPLAKAFEHVYYEPMVLLIRNIFEQALKTNDSLYFSVLTGCLRIAKESIFTGLNNPKVLSISEAQFDEYFGFTDEEVRELLKYYNISEAYDTIKEWYNGYEFGNTDVYCPWDVLNYCDALCTDCDVQPRDYWSNTSSNDAVKRFIEQAETGTTKREIERLVAGDIISKEIHQELTYMDMYQSIDNIWSVLYTTGYLTKRGKPEGDVLHLTIPNMEIRKIFTRQIMEWFKENVKKDGTACNQFCEALKNGDAKSVEQQFDAYLRQTISIRDTFVRKDTKENFYHGILLGILGYKDTWGISSNKETGDGYSDILVEIDEEEMGIVIEVKYAKDGKLEEACNAALKQIEERRYEEELYEEGMTKILKYGIACYKKRCMVVLGDIA